MCLACRPVPMIELEETRCINKKNDREGYYRDEDGEIGVFEARMAKR